MDTYAIAADRSTLSVGVRRLLSGRGTFPRITGSVTADENETPRALQVSIDARSLRTGLSLRDQHLKTASFLDTQRYPLITFSSEQIEKLGSDRYAILGRLRLHGREHPITLEARLELVDGTDDARHVRFSGAVSSAALAFPPNPLLRILVRVMFGDEVAVTGRVCLIPARESVGAESASLRGGLSQG